MFRVGEIHENMRLRNNLVLTHKKPCSKIDLEAARQFKFSKKPD